MTKKTDLSVEESNFAKTQEISPKGSLGILAYGARGILAWREVRIKNAEKKMKKSN